VQLKKEGIPMTEKLHVVCDPAASSESIKATEAALLKELLAQIRSDSTRESDDYLGETNVPHGGE
jgi:hypothetical protein